LAHKQGQLKLADLSNQNLLLLEDGHCLRDQALEVCHLAGAAERSGFRATSLETLRQMVAANVGITLLPVTAV
jgi:LysR family hydrogen peroxide-inducible transcriptional activator